VCGFIGQISKSNINHENISSQNERIICRGPDEKKHIYGKCSEFNISSNLNYSFIFNRLSIIDLSDKASQPMYSKIHNSMILFNGEIYNHRELRKELENAGYDFNSNHSDTEVILIGINTEGIDFIKKLIGQYSIVFIDFNKMRAYLIRDRLGQKPLFYSIEDESFNFSSNLKSISNIVKHKSISEKGIDNFLNYGVVPSPDTIFKNIYKVEPAQIVEVNLAENQIIKKATYWKPHNFIDDAPFNEDDFFSLLKKSILLRSNADVDIGSFLSGGIDSTTISKVQHELGLENNTFSVGYSDKKYDESHWFNLAANQYSSKHKTEILTPEDIEESIDLSIDIFDEPYSDPSTVPSYMLSKKISKYYKVAITGDGGDELLLGYDRIQQLLNQQKYPDALISNIFNKYPPRLGSGNKVMSKSNNLKKAYTSYFSDKKLLEMLNIKDDFTFEEKFSSSIDGSLKGYMLAEYKFYLPEMMMLKVDRTSMASSLEARSPFVDHNLIEYVLSRNLNFLIDNPKLILQKYLDKDLGISFTQRKKMGFVFNLENWVYSNKDYLRKYFKEFNESGRMTLQSFNYLQQNKSRVNAQRIWRLYILERFLLIN